MSRAALLVLADGRFPAGGHAHSGGVEAAVARGPYHDADSLEAFCRGRLHTAGLVAAGAGRRGRRRTRPAAAGRRRRRPHPRPRTACRRPQARPADDARGPRHLAVGRTRPPGRRPAPGRPPAHRSGPGRPRRRARPAGRRLCRRVRERRRPGHRSGAAAEPRPVRRHAAVWPASAPKLDQVARSRRRRRDPRHDRGHRRPARRPPRRCWTSPREQHAAWPVRLFAS